MLNLVTNDISQEIEQLAQIGSFCSARNLVPATSSNFSIKLNDQEIAITISGKDKAKLDSEDIMIIDFEGKAINSQAKPSAETLLHTQIYKWAKRTNQNINCVVHVHSNSAVVLSRKIFQNQNSLNKTPHLSLSNYELLKALKGIRTHEHTELIPVFANTQNIAKLAQELDEYCASIDKAEAFHAYLIEGHGIYTWGSDYQEAIRHLDCLDTLMNCYIQEETLWRS